MGHWGCLHLLLALQPPIKHPTTQNHLLFFCTKNSQCAGDFGQGGGHSLLFFLVNTRARALLPNARTLFQNPALITTNYKTSAVTPELALKASRQSSNGFGYSFGA
jgi:hypothetical protein